MHKNFATIAKTSRKKRTFFILTALVRNLPSFHAYAAVYRTKPFGQNWDFQKGLQILLLLCIFNHKIKKIKIYLLLLLCIKIIF